MKTSFKLFQQLTLLTGLFLSVNLAEINAQGNPPDDGGPTPTNQPAEIPIDGGASLLVAGGVAYGLKKLRDRRKSN